MENKFDVVGTFRQAHKDCEGDTQRCNSYDEALKLKEEWKKEKKYKDVFIVKVDEN